MSTPDGEETAKSKLLETIQQTILSDVNTYPNWISQQKSLKLTKLASSSADLKVFLRHITFPQVLESYNDFFTELSTTNNNNSDDNQGNTSSYQIPLTLTPIYSANDKEQKSIRNFFQSLNAKSGGISDIDCFYLNLTIF